MLVHERLIIQSVTAETLQGRVFGIKDSLTAWAFAVAFLSAGGLMDLAGLRPMLFLAGGLGIAVWLGATVALRFGAAGLPRGSGGVRRHGPAGKEGTTSSGCVDAGRDSCTTRRRVDNTGVERDRNPEYPRLLALVEARVDDPISRLSCMRRSENERARTIALRYPSGYPVPSHRS